MNKWIVEDWAFDIEVIEGDATNCRLGLEKGDKFHFEYECPQNLHIVKSFVAVVILHTEVHLKNMK